MFLYIILCVVITDRNYQQQRLINPTIATANNFPRYLDQATSKPIKCLVCLSELMTSAIFQIKMSAICSKHIEYTTQTQIIKHYRADERKFNMLSNVS